MPDTDVSPEMVIEAARKKWPEASVVRLIHRYDWAPDRPLSDLWWVAIGGVRDEVQAPTIPALLQKLEEE